MMPRNALVQHMIGAVGSDCSLPNGLKLHIRKVNFSLYSTGRLRKGYLVTLGRQV